MRKHPRFVLWFIILITAVAILIDAPAFPLHMRFTLPIIGKSVTITHYPGFSLNFKLGNTLIQKSFPFREGLDLQGGTSITLQADMTNIPLAERSSALQSVQTVLEQRVNLYGISEPVIQTETTNNDYRVLVELPGVDSQQTLQLVGTTAQLSFWEQGTKLAASSSALPLGLSQVIGMTAQKTNLTGKDLQSATSTFDNSTGEPEVQLVFNSAGTQKFADITKKNIGKVVAIVLDNAVVEAPRVNQAILGGDAVISGGFTANQANQLAIELQAGALPVPLKPLATQTI